MAHKKAAGSATNLTDSPGQRLGVKLHDGQSAKAGSIIIRQRGTKYRAGKNVRLGKDHTIFSVINGIVKFTTKKITKYTGQLVSTKFVNVISR
ncbi:MAG: 50S ribosomal protein L27 [Candidatus Falkowbacteria bacterium]|nr:50S ribosomal protein L27 [Candidatus Falkowbacteria bacterium]